MDPVEFIAWQTQPLQWFGLLAMACAAAALTLELARRAGRHRGAMRWMWLTCGALALGSGLWSGHFIALSGPQLPIGIGYGGWLSLAAWAAAFCAALGALAITAGGQVTLWRSTASAAVLGIGAFASEWLCFLDMNMAPPITWHPGWAAAAIAVITFTGAACHPLASSLASGARRWVQRAVAPLLLGTGLALGHKASALAARIDLEAISLNHLSGLTGNSLTVLACFGTGLVLLVMLMLVGVERRMQRALRQAVSTIEANASTDALTGLPNFRAFERCIEGKDRPATDQKAPVALLYIALDGLKPVNESFGRPVGDHLLQDIVRRLKALQHGDSKLARVGGDEFALMLFGESKAETVLKLAHEVLASVSATGSIDGHDIALSCSIGMVMYPQHGSRAKMLVRGEAAAQAVKKAGGAAASFFDPQLLAGTRDQLELLQDLRSAIGTGQLELYYQPKIHAESGAVTGAEALMRWHHPKRGMVSPGIFIPLAERHGLINALGDWLIDEACRQARVWRDQGLRMRVAINMSVSQLRQSGMAERIAQSLARYQINPQQLTCEITESLAMEESSATARFFEDIARIGVHISIDDFGTGYSSLAYLRKLPAEELKIDRSFVLDLETSADARAIVDAVVKLAQALGLKVVAEGVETEAQNQILRGLGCDELQGFLFAKPMSAKALGVWAMTSDGPAPLKFRDSLFLETQAAEMR